MNTIYCTGTSIFRPFSRLLTVSKIDFFAVRGVKPAYSRRLFLTCDLGLDLALHLQRVDEDAAVTDEAGAGYASVRLAESLFFDILPETYRKTERRE